MSGRVTGRVSEDGQRYELVQNGEVRQSVPISEADDRLRKAIKRNAWEPLP